LKLIENHSPTTRNELRLEWLNTKKDIFSQVSKVLVDELNAISAEEQSKIDTPLSTPTNKSIRFSRCVRFWNLDISIKPRAVIVESESKDLTYSKISTKTSRKYLFV
jgi:hypothetical protein